MIKRNKYCWHLAIAFGYGDTLLNNILKSLSDFISVFQNRQVAIDLEALSRLPHDKNALNPLWSIAETETALDHPRPNDLNEDEDSNSTLAMLKLRKLHWTQQRRDHLITNHWDQHERNALKQQPKHNGWKDEGIIQSLHMHYSALCKDQGSKREQSSMAQFRIGAQWLWLHNCEQGIVD